MYSYDTVTGEWSSQEVVQTFENKYVGEIVTLQIGDEAIEATASHPFWVIDTKKGGGRWVEAKDLQVGDQFLDPFGNEYSLAGISVREESVTVYNFEVAGTHTYLVSQLGILVHNVGCRRNSHMAGGNHPVTGIPFDKEGYPDFSSVTQKEVQLPSFNGRGPDERAADKLAGINAKYRSDNGLTWHHHQDKHTMQLVPTQIHVKTGHTGGLGN